MARAIGVVSESVGTTTVVDSCGSSREVGSGAKIFEGDVGSAKGAGSSVDIAFNNGCKMTLVEDESALIDESVYKLEFFDDVDVVVDLDSVEVKVVDVEVVDVV